MEAYKRMLEDDRGMAAEEDADADDTGLPSYTTPRGSKYYGQTCFVLAPTDPVRQACCRLIDYGSHEVATPSYWDRAVMAVIAYSAIHLARFDPYDKNASSVSEVELFFNAAFSFELFVVVMARGLIVPKNAYLQDLWGWLDLSVVIAGWLPLFFNSCARARATHAQCARTPRRMACVDAAASRHRSARTACSRARRAPSPPGSTHVADAGVAARSLAVSAAPRRSSRRLESVSSLRALRALRLVKFLKVRASRVERLGGVARVGRCRGPRGRERAAAWRRGRALALGLAALGMLRARMWPATPAHSPHRNRLPTGSCSPATAPAPTLPPLPPPPPPPPR